jgi:Ca-activated chloride channel family protein
MTTENNDPQLDARLCDVPLPAGLLERLRGAIVPEDAEIDRRLRDVAAPAGLVDRIKTSIDEEVLVEQLADVPLPERLMPRLRVVPQLRTRSRAARYSLASSLMVALSVGWLLLLGGLLAQMRPSEPLARGPFELPLSTPPEIDSGIAFVAPLEGEQPRRVESAPPAAEPLGVAIELAGVSPPPAPPPGPAGTLLRELSEGLELGANIYDLQLTSLPYAHSADDNLPQLEPPPQLLTGGFEPPPDPAFDRVAFYRDGVFPTVPLEKGSRLAESHPPLTTRTTAVERLRHQLEIGRSPAQSEIRVEDFLASLDYQFDPVDQPRLAIRTAAGPSVFSETGAGLLQIGVKAGSTPRTSKQGVHLIVALDVSASMRRHDRLEWCREGLRRALAYMEPDDRFTLLAFNDDIVASAENVSSDQLEGVYQLLDNLRPQGHTNLARVLTEAAAAGAADVERSARVVLITDGPGELPEQLSRQVMDVLDESYKAKLDNGNPQTDDSGGEGGGVTTSVIELSEGYQADPQLGRLADAGHGVYYPQTSSAQHIRWTLVEALSGRSSLVAEEAALTVTFNPQAVEAYRLLGHERTLVSDLADASVTANLHSSEEASVLYEVWLKPGTENHVADAQVRWRDSATGQMRQSARQPISRLQFALSFEQSPLSLQAAALAAETAEVLRGSPYVKAPGRGLQDVLSRAERVRPELAERHDFRRFVELLGAAQGVRVRRSGT